jgi:hypothetical protein
VIARTHPVAKAVAGIALPIANQHDHPAINVRGLKDVSLPTANRLPENLSLNPDLILKLDLIVMLSQPQMPIRRNPLMQR